MSKDFFPPPLFSTLRLLLQAKLDTKYWQIWQQKFNQYRSMFNKSYIDIGTSHRCGPVHAAEHWSTAMGTFQSWLGHCYCRMVACSSFARLPFGGLQLVGKCRCCYVWSSFTCFIFEKHVGERPLLPRSLPFTWGTAAGLDGAQKSNHHSLCQFLTYKLSMISTRTVAFSALKVAKPRTANWILASLQVSLFFLVWSCNWICSRNHVEVQSRAGRS